MSLLLELMLRGSVAALIIFLFDRAIGGGISGPSRRLWWCLLPLAFLVPLRIPIFPALGHLRPVTEFQNQASLDIPAGAVAAAKASVGGVSLGMDIWLAGAFAYVAVVGLQTARASRRWSRERLSTDHSMLELLEDCKAETGVTAPIGLVVSCSVPSPAILGWLRPRILLPESLVAHASTAQLRPILLHELAHFRWLDVPFNWLLTLVRAVHWFNPIAHFGAVSWTHFREEAADEAAVKWMRADSAQAYGDALVRSLRQCRGDTIPFGSVAIVESVRHLKRRLRMINRCQDKAPRVLLTGMASLLLAALVCSISATAADSKSSDPNVAVVASVQVWLKEIDTGQFQQSWDESSTWFHRICTSEEWIADMTRIRGHSGECTGRKQTKMEFQSDPPPHRGSATGEWAYVHFDSSFENGKRTELVALMKEADGAWKVAGYAITDQKT